MSTPAKFPKSIRVKVPLSKSSPTVITLDFETPTLALAILEARARSKLNDSSFSIIKVRGRFLQLSQCIQATPVKWVEQVVKEELFYVTGPGMDKGAMVDFY